MLSVLTIKKKRIDDKTLVLLLNTVSTLYICNFDYFKSIVFNQLALKYYLALLAMHKVLLNIKRRKEVNKNASTNRKDKVIRRKKTRRYKKNKKSKRNK